MAKKRNTAMPAGARRKPATGSMKGEWDSFERSVIRSGSAPAATGSRSTPAPCDADEVLLRLAKRSQIVRGRQPALGNVVFLHGITGSDLAVSRGAGKLDSIWVSLVSVVAGGMKKLRLAADGSKGMDSSLRVHATGINKRFYGRAVLALRAHWNVEPFAYDWRKDIDEAADNLATLIRQRFGNEPVHLVAHSMGGLVARNFIRRHREQWQAMKDPKLVRGGRLVMLGTPNYGSYAILQVLSGTDALLSRLERFDLQHNMNQLLEITNSFPGTYQLMPALSHLTAAEQGLYEQPTWGATRGISQRHLDRALELHRQLETAATTDPQRLICVAGVNQSTIQGVRVLGPGQFEYQLSTDGDGRVPLRLGCIPGVPCYYVDELHGDLAKNEQILLSLDELLQTGSTGQLSRSAAAAIATRGGAPAIRSARGYRAPDRGALDLLTEMAARTRQAGDVRALTPAEQQLAADAILNAAVSARTDVTAVRQQQAAAVKPKAGDVARKRQAAKPLVTLRVGVRFGRIEKFRAPIAVVGHYRGVKPVKAIGAIDRALDHWLTRAVRRGMISGQTGETFFIPTQGRGVSAEGVIIAGMGDYGTFSTSSLRRVMANVAQGATALGIHEVATVLIGSGEGGLNAEAALRHLIEGFASGIAEFHEEQPARAQPVQATLWIVELNAQRFVALDREVRLLAERLSIDGVLLKPVAAPRAMREKARRDFRSHAEREFDRAALTDGAPADANELCLTVETDPDQTGGALRFNFSALTDRALVPVQKIEVTAAVVKDLGDRLCEVTAPKAQEQYGRLLFRYLLPRQFASLFEAEGNIRLIVDSAAAAFPWEMACFASTESPDQLQRFGVERRLTRQFKSLVSGSVGLIPPRNEKLRALVIADPAREPEWRLPGARAEGHLVARLLRFANGMELRTGNRLVKLDIDVQEFIGHEDCEPLDLIARLTSGDYDLVHYAGHGIYDGAEPTKSGWVLGADYFVTARDIARSRQTPWLIFANACFSAVVNGLAQQQPIETARQAASIAESFMHLGVRNYLGTGWMVDDDQAQRFAREFYFGLLFGNQRLGVSLGEARAQLIAEGQGSTWGAYQFYGDPADRLLPRLDDQPLEAVSGCRERFEAADV